MNHFRSVAEAALWFAESFSLVSNQIVRVSTANLPFPMPASHGELGGAWELGYRACVILKAIRAWVWLAILMLVAGLSLSPTRAYRLLDKQRVSLRVQHSLAVCKTVAYSPQTCQLAIILW